MAVEVPIDIRNWRGLNIYQSPGSIDDTELVEATNFDIGITGELIKRSGFELLNSSLGANQVHMLAFLKTNTLHRLVARAGTTLYYSDNGTTWAELAPETAPSFVQFSSTNANASGITTCPVPVGTLTGDFLLAQISTGGITGLTLPPGWTLVTGGNSQGLAYKFAAGETTFDFTFSGANDRRTVTIGAFRNVNSSSPINVSEFTSSNHGQLSGVTTTVNNCLLLGLALNLGTTITPPAGMTERWDISDGGGSGTQFAEGCTEAFLTAGTTGIRYFNGGNTTGFQATALLALAPSGGPTGNVLHAVQYTDSLYMARDDGVIVKYDGTTLTSITSSPVGSFVITFKDRLFVINSFAVTNSSRLWFSEVGDFSSAGWPSTNFIDVNPGDGDFLVGAAIINDVLVLFKTRSSWALYVQGSPDNWVLRKTSDQIGCISKDSIREIEGFLYFAGPRGVYRSDGTNISLISLPIDPAFRGFVITAISANKASAAFYDNKYILYLPIYTSSTQPTWGAWSATTWSQHEQQTWDQTVAQSGDNIYVYHVRVGGWSRWEPSAGITPRTFVDVRTDDPIRGLYSGDSAFTGKVFRFGQGVFQDNGVNYACAFETKDFDFAQLTRYKRGKWVGIDCEGLGSVTYNSIADSETQGNLPVVQVARRATYKIAGPGYFRTWRLRGSHIGEGPFTLYGLRIHMAIKRTIIGSPT